MINFIEYKRISLDFRRIASKVLTTNYDEGNLHLIRMKIYIQQNSTIREILESLIKDVKYDYKDNFIVRDGGWSNLNVPIGEAEHIKAVYDYLIDMTMEEKDISGIARGFHCSSSSWNDIIRNYMVKVFKPLIDFIIDSISKEMMILEQEKTGTNIHQSIHNNYGTANVAQGDITSVNNTNINNLNEIIDLIKDSKDLIEKSDLDNDVKEEVIDDLETVQEQVEAEVPKFVKLKKAYQGIKTFISSIPSGIANAASIVTKLTDLTDKISNFMETMK